ncbi:phosphonate C-P lyase system protein PhnH [Sulfitobacter guttiformis]|uniref:Alpha-D-ribose 1-methylphosphonate 5-triphosphate synthase subunit PhnH n=1 Tax=Sulfitobacter guttiformis TaxID=74349 RepID=A0A420DT42_9RHOB|nr:phosphonate C-P lyase system protein PhnH [Sulfitobacter guttiformis]KIN71017.1 Phosphonate C-P lyase system protein PhnH [Sulfitobacter guttiformis KCTC 32187]RKE97501.1 alpha-D-ribose 1-methylphosphonate 5-triphosphate synthase subunit PhnH [Sulfitobacter guttiformis]
MQAHVLEGGFGNIPVEASHAFRAIMTAMARPGQIMEITGAQPPAPLSPAAGAVLLTLCDPETPVFLTEAYDTPQIRDWITFHTGAPSCDPFQAMFALGSWDQLNLAKFSRGTAEYPDRSATLIVEVGELANEGATLKGPGIEGHARLSLPETGLFQDNAQYYPLGLDFIFTNATRLAGLPRTTRIS